MEVSHKNDILARPATERLRQFVRKRCQQWETGEENLDFEIFERELHEHMMVLERELIAEELSRYDVDVEEIEVAGRIYRQALTSTETYEFGRGSDGGTSSVPTGRTKHQEHMSTGIADGNHSWLVHATGSSSSDICHGTSDTERGSHFV
jgi:hypothetical protein